MMYLEFSVFDGKPECLSHVICTEEYSVAEDDKGLRIYYDKAKSLWMPVAYGKWLNCNVYGADRKLLFTYIAGDTDER